MGRLRNHELISKKTDYNNLFWVHTIVYFNYNHVGQTSMAKLDNNNVPGLKFLTSIKFPPTIWLRVTHGCTKFTEPLFTPPPRCGTKFLPRLSLNFASRQRRILVFYCTFELPRARHHKKTGQTPKPRGKTPNYLPILVWTLVIPPFRTQIYTRVFSFDPRILVDFGHTSAIRLEKVA